RRARDGAWPSGWPAPPRFDSAIGVELRTRTARLAQRALESDAVILAADTRRLPPPACRTALLLDVLHMMPKPEQDAVIASLASALDADGVILVREADASAGWRFAAVRVGNR